MKKLIRAVSLLLLLLMIAGCTSETTTPEQDDMSDGTVGGTVEGTNPEADVPEEEAAPEPEPIVPTFGGTLNVAMSPADTLDPLENRIDNVAQVLNLVYEPLFTFDSTYLPVPLLVESYDFILDGKGVEIRLKDGIIFHDGTPLTGDDVAYTVNYLRDSKTSPYKSLVLPVTRVSVDNENKLIVRFYYDQAYAFMIQDLSFPIVSEAYYRSSDFDPMMPVGTGPYKFVEYQNMQHMDLVANDNWHGGTLYVENVHVVAMNETTNMETLFDQHLIDVMAPSRFNWLKYSEKDDQRIERYNAAYCDFIGFSPASELLQDSEIRKAIAYAIDREALIYNQFINHAIVSDTPIMPGSWFDSGRETTYNYNMEKAIEKLGKIPYSDNDGDGLLDIEDSNSDTGFTNIELRMLVNSESSTRTAAAPVLEHYIEALGFEVTVEAVDSAVYIERITSGDYDLLYGGWKLTAKPDFMSILSSEGAQNYFGYSSDEMDLTLRSLTISRDEASVIQRVSEFQDLFLEDMPFLTLYFLEGAVMYHGNVYGELMPGSGNAFNNIQNLYLNLNKEK